MFHGFNALSWLCQTLKVAGLQGFRASLLQSALVCKGVGAYKLSMLCWSQSFVAQGDLKAGGVQGMMALMFDGSRTSWLQGFKALGNEGVKV